MNRDASFGFPLSSKFAVGIAAATLIPLLLLVILLLSGLGSLNQNNIAAYLIEGSIRRQQALTQTLTQAQVQLDTFVKSPVVASAVRRALDASSLTDGTTSINIEEVFANVAQSLLLGTDSNYFSSVWLLSARGELVASQVTSGNNLPFNRSLIDQRDSEIYRTLRELGLRSASSTGTQSTIVAALRDDSISLEMGYVLVTGRGIQGYVVAAINQQALLDLLRPQDNLLNAYSFLIMPNGRLLSLPFTERFVSLDSDGSRAALNDVEAQVRLYTTNTTPPRQVYGYYERVSLDNYSFTLVTELDANAVSRPATSYIGNIAFPLFLASLVLIGIATGFFNQLLVPPLMQLREAFRAMSNGRYDTPVTSTQRGDELGSLAISFVDMRQQVSQVLNNINAQLNERQRDLRISQDISRSATAERNLQAVMDKVVGLIVENFPTIYHAQIFLVDADDEFAVLRASTGEPGRRLLARGHKLGVGSVSVIGQVTELGETVIARDTSASNVHRQNEFLPDTRAELAIPLKLGNKVIGALDVQSKQSDSFSPEQVLSLQTLADQLTIAIENARLYEESQRLLTDIEAERQARTSKAWNDYLSAERVETLASRAGNQTDYDFEVLRQAALAGKRPVVGTITPRKTIPFVVPIQLRGQTVGVVEYELIEREFNYNKVLLAEELVNRLAVSLDNARLFQDSQRATERERLVNEISAKLTGQTDLEEILQVAVREIGLALRTPQVMVSLQTANGNGHSNGNGNHQAEYAPHSTASDMADEE